VDPIELQLPLFALKNKNKYCFNASEARKYGYNNSLNRTATKSKDL
jgi:hypothetical protein